MTEPLLTPPLPPSPPSPSPWSPGAPPSPAEWPLRLSPCLPPLPPQRRELHPSHFSVDQALGELARLEPAPALGLLVGFAHDVEHEGLEAELRGLRAAGRLALEVRPAHDGMRLRLPWGERDAAAAPADRECIQ
eukprot:tig00000076_g2340.t1